MNFSLVYQGSPGSVTARLSADGAEIASQDGLKDERDARKWAQNFAREWKAGAAAPPREEHQAYVHLVGTKAFTL